MRSNDWTMARIEAAREILIDRAAVGRGVADQRVKVLALIRSKLPQPDAKPIDKPRSLLEGHGIGAGIDHRDPCAWGEDDDRFRANEEHDRAVEAWQESFREFTVCVGGYECSHEQHSRWRAVLDEALRLMRARPAPHTFYGGTERSYAELVAKEKAAGELLKLAGELVGAVSEVVPDEPLDELSPIFQLETKRHHWEYVVDCRDRMEKAIAKAERAGIKP